MSMQEETRDVVTRYFVASTTRNVEEAQALLADDLQFAGPMASYQSADAFRPALVNFAAMTRSARMTTLLVEGDRAAMLYDCELPHPIGTVRIASFFQVQDGRIRTYETLFDTTEYRKHLAQRSDVR